jgi:chromosome segregation ATPase
VLRRLLRKKSEARFNPPPDYRFPDWGDKISPQQNISVPTYQDSTEQTLRDTIEDLREDNAEKGRRIRQLERERDNLKIRVAQLEHQINKAETYSHLQKESRSIVAGLMNLKDDCQGGPC